MSRWERFRTVSDEQPENWFEASVFLTNASLHITNQSHTDDTFDACMVILDAQVAINRDQREVAA